MDAEQYFQGHERDIKSVAELHERVQQIGALADLTRLRFYWRGQSDSAWGVHSLLHRRLAILLGIPIESLLEAAVVAKELDIVDAAREWIRPAVGARLTTIDLLARLQHFGVPTRLIDFTSEPKVAAYFAVIDQPTRDGRLVVAAATRSTSDDFRNSFTIPWARQSPARPPEWTRQLYVLDDHADFLRIINQRGVFLTGGTPSSRPVRRTAKGPALKAAEVRRCMSMPLALHGWSQAEAAVGGTFSIPASAPVSTALTLRIPRSVKDQIRRDLEGEGYSMSQLFPDPEGYRQMNSVIRDLLQ